jgi:hypothetical protein
MDTLYLKPTMTLGPFWLTNGSGFRGNITAFMVFYHTVNYMPWLLWLNQLKVLCGVTVLTQQLNNPKPLLCKAETSLNLNHFKMVEGMGLKLLHQGPSRPVVKTGRGYCRTDVSKG